MSNSKYISFSELFNEEEVGIRHIVIPKVQRAYAQGRLDSRATRVRTRFLNAIYEALDGDTGKGLTLDFIYGNVGKDGQLIPLDGQQRLTTLFLLYWYAAKRENRDAKECEFLKSFSYETRYSARDFCKKIVEFSPSFIGCLSEEIKDQTWFPTDWQHDSTVASMLVMLDDIHNKFHCIDDLWNKLERIKFYFLKLEDMNLTDEIYIKMNSRGKPLTDFENFKAEFEKNLEKHAPEKLSVISKKIDTVWTDLLWKYTMNTDSEDDRPSTDDAFLRYFRYVCDIICYKSNGSPQTSDDEFTLLKKYFADDESKVAANIETLCSFFDCWLSDTPTGKGNNIGEFFDSFLSNDHDDNKVKLPSNYSTNLFRDCINDYSSYFPSGKRRKFPLNKIILLYATIVYLQNKSTINCSDFVRRYRIVNNLVLNSEYEISDSENRIGGNRMPAILKQVDSIILNGVISDNIVIDDNGGCINFNAIQLKEEKEKQVFLSDFPEFTKALYRLEDHPLLYGQIGVIGIDHTENFEKFESLFNCDWDLVDCALFAIGDYSQRDNYWRIQIGTSNKNIQTAWANLFHRGVSDNGFGKTKECLNSLMNRLGDDISDSHLQTIIDDYIETAERESRFEWRYYYVKYSSFRMGRYGKYEQNEKSLYHITGIFAPSRVSSNSYELFLKEMNDKCVYIDDNTTKIGEVFVRNNNDNIEIYDVDRNTIKIQDIEQNGNVDVVNRIELGREILKEYA